MSLPELLRHAWYAQRLYLCMPYVLLTPTYCALPAGLQFASWVATLFVCVLGTASIFALVSTTPVQQGDGVPCFWHTTAYYAMARSLNVLRVAAHWCTLLQLAQVT
jgi:hypothetical protein